MLSGPLQGRAAQLTQNFSDDPVAVQGQAVLVEQFRIALQPPGSFHESWLVIVAVVSWYIACAVQLLQPHKSVISVA